MFLSHGILLRLRFSGRDGMIRSSCYG